MSYITTKEAAKIIDCTDVRVRQLLNSGKIRGKLWGRDWQVLKSSAERYAQSSRRPGPRPKHKIVRSK